MAKEKWIHLTFAPNVLKDDKLYEILVYADKHNMFYFFANAVFWCLGFEEPHVSVQQFVPPNEQHRLSFGSGIFLKETTVRKLINDRLRSGNLKFKKFQTVQRFDTWFNNYLVKCKSNNPGRTCPY